MSQAKKEAQAAAKKAAQASEEPAAAEPAPAAAAPAPGATSGPSSEPSSLPNPFAKDAASDEDAYGAESYYPLGRESHDESRASIRDEEDYGLAGRKLKVSEIISLTIGDQ